MLLRRRVVLLCRRRQFSIYSAWRNEKRNDQPPTSPLRIFVDTFKAELKKSQELQDNLKLLSNESDKIADSPQYKSARSAYSKAKERADAASSRSGKLIKAASDKVGSAVGEAWDSEVGKAGRKAIGGAARGVGRVLDESTKPVRDSEVYKTVSKNVGEVIDDGSSSRYGGYLEREERRVAREAWIQRQQHKHTNADVNAGQAVVMHKDSKWKEGWDEFKNKSPIWARLSSIGNTYNESENSLVSTVRAVTDRVSDFFTTENEAASVIRHVKAMDPTFQTESFLRELREYILPEVVDAYVRGDTETLQVWLGQGPFAVWSTLNKQYAEKGLVSAGIVRDIRGVDIATYRLLENDIPVFIVSFRSQETHLYRDAKTGEIVAGVEDKIGLVQNVAAFVRLETELTNAETRGWRIMDFQRSQARDFY